MSTADSPAGSVPLPTPQQVRWQDFEVGLVVHFDMPVFAPEGWAHAASRRLYAPDAYAPSSLDTDQWVEAAKAAGARFILFTATHFNGFLQWQSDLYPYGVRQSAWRHGRGDVVGDFVESCRRAGMPAGLYMSCNGNAWWKVWRHRVNWGDGGEAQGAFVRTCERMVAELCTRYGELAEIWFDAGLLPPDADGPDVLPIVERHQPRGVFYHSPQRRDHRWIGNEDGVAPYPCWARMPDIDAAEAAHHGRCDGWRDLLASGDPDGTLWSPAMCDAPIRDHEWFWRPDEDHKIQPLDRLVGMYYKSVGRNGTLILGATPNRDGLIPEADFRRYAEFGAEIRRRFASPIAETSGTGEAVELALPAPSRIGHVVLMEDIEHGERVCRYRVEGRVGGDSWRTLCDGTAIGHKCIQEIGPVEVAAVRFVCTEAVAPPLLRQLAVYAPA